MVDACGECPALCAPVAGALQLCASVLAVLCDAQQLLLLDLAHRDHDKVRNVARVFTLVVACAHVRVFYVACHRCICFSIDHSRVPSDTCNLSWWVHFRLGWCLSLFLVPVSNVCCRSRVKFWDVGVHRISQKQAHAYAHDFTQTHTQARISAYTHRGLAS